MLNNKVNKKIFFSILIACLIPYTLGMAYLGQAIKAKFEQDYINCFMLAASKLQYVIDETILAPACREVARLAKSEKTVAMVQEIGDQLVFAPGQIESSFVNNFALFSLIHQENITSLELGTQSSGYFSYPDYCAEKSYNPCNQLWYQTALNNQDHSLLIRSYLRGNNREATLAVVHTVGDEQQIVGVISARLNLQRMQHLVEKMESEIKGCIIVLDAHDNIIVSPQQPEWLFKTPQELLLTDLMFFRDRQESCYSVKINGKEQNLLCSISPQTGWAVIALVDSAAWQSNAEQLLAVLLCIYLFVFCWLAAVFFLAGSYVTRPILELLRGAQAITSGKLDTHVKIKGKDQFGLLANAFNQMADKLQINFMEIQRQNEEIRKREQEFQSLVENAQDVIFRMDKSYRYLYVNPAIELYSGVPAVSHYGHTNQEMGFNAEYCRQMESGCHKVFRTGKDLLLELEFIAVKKETVFFQAHLLPEFDVHGRVETVLSIMRNTTERKNMERQLVRLDRLNLVGEMAAGIAHEVRNPMTTVRGYLQMIVVRNQCPQYQSQFQLMIEELDRANSILTEFLSLAKNKRVDLQPADLNEVVKALQPLVSSDAYIAGKTAKWELENIPQVLLDEKEIRQLIMNLVKNGLEAMDRGGCLTVKTYSKADFVVLAVQDEGTGISTDVMDKLGMPFMTTKESGTGLGLAVCYSVAARHKAKIRVRTTAAGTTFYVVFSKKEQNLSEQELKR